jgi:hypothetical protein
MSKEKPLRVTASFVEQRGSKWYLSLEIELPFKLRAKIAPKMFRSAVGKEKYRKYVKLHKSAEPEK